jgi:hypothetical protein
LRPGPSLPHHPHPPGAAWLPLSHRQPYPLRRSAAERSDDRGAARGRIDGAAFFDTHGTRSTWRRNRVLFKACGGTKANLSHLQYSAPHLAARTANGGQTPWRIWIFVMATPTDLEPCSELAEHCLWEAERTLDREVANSLRALAGRYRRMSERSPQQADRSSAHVERTGAR